MIPDAITGGAGTNPVLPLPNAVDELDPPNPGPPAVLPAAKPGRPHVADEDEEPKPLLVPVERLDSFPVRRRGCDAGAEELVVIGGEADVPGCAGTLGDAIAGDRATDIVRNCQTELCEAGQASKSVSDSTAIIMA